MLYARQSLRRTETDGHGDAAVQGDTVECESQAVLIRRDPAQEPLTMSTRLVKRQVIAGVEQALLGMRAGAYRTVRIGPHLSYRDAGVPDKVPHNAVMIYELWMRCMSKNSEWVAGRVSPPGPHTTERADVQPVRNSPSSPGRSDGVPRAAAASRCLDSARSVPGPAA